MRTKALLCLAAVAASAVTAMAQSNVYSLNIVGYVNIPVEANKFYMLGNPLKVTEGNSITNVLKLDDTWDSTTVYGWTSTGFTAPQAYIASVGWLPGDIDLAPGSGFFIYPTKAGTLTFVGEVVLTNTTVLPAGFTMTASAYPAALSLTALGLTGVDSDTVYRFNATTGYLPSIAFIGGLGWLDSGVGDGGPVTGPTLNVGEGIFYYNANTPFTWNQAFTVQ